MYIVLLILPMLLPGLLPPQSARLSAENEKKRQQAEFSRNFSGLQNVAYTLVRDHVAGKLTPEKLAREMKRLHSHARNLRSVLLLGELENPVQENKDSFDTPGKFDQALRRLSRLIYTFAHNPVHQNRRVFNTDQAQRALADLETIILLAKAIETQAKSYQTSGKTSTP